MKPLKSSRAVKSPAGRSPIKKIPASRKQGSFRPPQHFVSNRSVSGGNISGGMKQSEMSSMLHSRSSKPSHLSRQRAFTPPQRLPPRKSHHSALSFDRARGLKRSYENKQFSHSPIERRITESSRMMLPRSSSPHMHSLPYGSLPKKTRREEPHFRQSSSPPRYPPNSRSREKNRQPRSESQVIRHDPVHPTSSNYGYDDKKYMATSGKEKVYGTVHERYDVPHVSSNQLPREKVIMNADIVYHQREYSGGKRRGPETYILDKSKSYGLTLDERFRAVSCDSARARAEQHTQYSKEELENITIDIKRSMREYSPTVRRIMDPTDVKLVRRPEEGHHPIFDREEIRQASRDLREDAHIEQKMYSSRVSGHYLFNHKEMENYEITRHKFDTYRGPTLHMDGAYTLTEKWQRLENKKNEMSSAERDERERSFHQHTSVGDFDKKYRNARSSSVDRDFRIGNDNRSRSAYESDMQKALPSILNDTRYKESDAFFSHDDRPPVHRRGNSSHGSSETQNRNWYPNLQRHSTDIPIHGREKDPHSNRDGREPWINENYYDRARAKEEKVPMALQKSSRSKYNQYLDRSSEMPRASPFHKYDDRESPKHPRHFGNRGSFRGLRAKASRGRLFKAGASRGFRGRSLYQGLSSRARGFPSRRRMLSGSYPM